MTARPKIDAKDIEWEDVRKAAEKIVQIVGDVVYAPLEVHGVHINAVCEQMNRIAEALCLTRLHNEAKSQ